MKVKGRCTCLGVPGLIVFHGNKHLNQHFPNLHVHSNCLGVVSGSGGPGWRLGSCFPGCSQRLGARLSNEASDQRLSEGQGLSALLLGGPHTAWLRAHGDSRFGYVHPGGRWSERSLRGGPLAPEPCLSLASSTLLPMDLEGFSLTGRCTGVAAGDRRSLGEALEGRSRRPCPLHPGS